jgi:hypothetical protein
MAISGNNRSCETVNGWFVINSISYIADTVSAIDVTFEQRCGGTAAALRGRVRWSQ